MNKPPGSVAVDFHVHTAFSFDSLTPPKVAIEIARRRGLDGIAVTDHDTVRGALATMEANRYDDFFVIPGIEVKTDRGDLIGLYVTREIKSRKFADVIEEIQSQGGVAYLPHPVRTFGTDGTCEVYTAHRNIELWERFNGRYSSEEFAQGDALFERLGITDALCGSDAHHPWEIGFFRTVLPSMPLDGPSLCTLSRSAQLLATPRAEFPRRVGITLGEATKMLKRRQYSKLTRLAASLPWKALRRAALR